MSSGVGQAPASVRGAGTTSQFQKVVLDPISGHDLSRHADPVTSVHCKTDRDKGRKSPQDHRGVSFIPGPPSDSMASSSGPPFIPSSSGEGWDVQDAVYPDSPQVQVGLPRRIALHPLGSSVSGGSFMVVLDNSDTKGRRSFPPGARLELLLGRVRRRLGCHRRGTPSVRMRSIQIRLRSRWDFRDELLCIPWDPLCQEDLLWWSWTIQIRKGVDLSLPERSTRPTSAGVPS